MNVFGEMGRGAVKNFVLWAAIGIALASNGRASAADDIMATKAPPIPYGTPSGYNWTGFYAGVHMGVAWGSSNWTAGPGISGSTNLFQTLDAFDEGGSFFAGIQGGYNYMLPNRILLGAEIDASFPAWPTAPTGVNPFGVSIGGGSTFTSPTLGAVSFAETVLASGTMRGRIGYAPGSWLLYATAGFAWTYDRQSLTQVATGNSETPFLWRLGWTAGAGVEVPIAPHWTARAEYLFFDYGHNNQPLFAVTQPVNSDFLLQELRAGVNRQFGNDTTPAFAAPLVTKAKAATDPDLVNFHGQATFTWQGYPAFRSPYEGAQSLPGGGQGRETADATLYVGVRLWQGAEFWINPEIDQGFGIAQTLGVAGYTSGEAYKLGTDNPYTRVQRYFVRQTIDLGGETRKVDAGLNQFAERQTANRLVLTVGKFSVADIFDNNKYAHDPRNDFMNWSVVDTGTFDYAADPWGYTYGAAAEWFQGNWTLRGGLFDLSIVPNNIQLDPTFQEFQWVGEIERRYDLWGHRGKIAVTGFLSRARMGSFENAIALATVTGGSADIAAVRQYQGRGGVSMNIEQEITSDLGAFIRAGWADGNVEPYEFTDIDRTVAGGVSLSGKQWGRPDDTVGVAGVVNGIASVHQAFFNAGGLGILIGDGQLPNPGLEQIIEAYYSYALTASTRLSADYQFIVNPAYNTQRGPANVFAGRLHAQF